MTITNLLIAINHFCDADSTSFPNATKLVFINAVLEKIAGKLISFDMRWQWDDTNYTDFPQGKADLVAAQKDYSFDSTHLAIERVAIMDENGDYYYLKPIDKADLDRPWNEYFDTDGSPEYYDKEGVSILIGPGPAAGSVTTTDGLLVEFRRTSHAYTSADITTGTQEPGFASPFHMLLAYETAIDWCAVYKPNRVPALMKLSQEMWKDMEYFYCKRNKEDRNIILPKGINFR